MIKLEAEKSAKNATVHSAPAPKSTDAKVVQTYCDAMRESMSTHHRNAIAFYVATATIFYLRLPGLATSSA